MLTLSRTVAATSLAGLLCLAGLAAYAETL